jgi:hypothetical protein
VAQTMADTLQALAIAKAAETQVQICTPTCIRTTP